MLNEGSTSSVSSVMTEASTLQQQKAMAALKALGGSDKAEEKKLWEAARGFESMFMAQMYKSMRQTLPETEFNKPSTGRKIFTEMLDAEYAKMSSGKSKNGLAGMIYRQLLLSRNSHDKGGSAQMQIPEKLVKVQPDIMKGYANNLPKNVQLSERELEPMIQKAARKYSLEPNLIKSVINMESARRPHAMSHAGAKGLMQLMDPTAREMGVKDVYNPQENIMGGARYLKQLHDMYKGNEKLTLAAYNAGPGTVNRFGGIPPYPETQQYVKNVLQAKDTLNSKETGGQNEHGNAP